MAIPSAVDDFDAADIVFDEAACEEASLPNFDSAIPIACGFRFEGDVECFDVFAAHEFERFIVE